MGERENIVFVYGPLHLPSLFVGSTQSSNSSNLWHLHLGRSSSFVVENLLRKSSSVKHDLESPCSICLRAKQTRDIFHLSQSNSAKIFDLMHCDLWGPFMSLLMVSFISLPLWMIFRDMFGFTC